MTTKIMLDDWPTDDRPKCERTAWRAVTQSEPDTYFLHRRCLVHRVEVTNRLGFVSSVFESTSSLVLRSAVHRAMCLVSVSINEDGKRTETDLEVKSAFCADLWASAPQHSGLPVIERVVRGPMAFLDKSGELTLADAPGYHPDFRLWVEDYGEPSGAVSQEDVLERFEALNPATPGTLLGFLSAGLDQVCSGIHNDISPSYVTLAPKAGRGKTYFFRCLSRLRDGEYLASIAYGEGAELKRQVDTKLTSERSILMIDNIQKGANVKLENLLGMLTSHEFSTRLVGSGKETRVNPTDVIFGMSGIGVTFGDEASRRLIMLEIGEPAGGEHRFPRLDQWFFDHRSDVYAVFLDWIRRWDEAGRPGPPKTDSRIAKSFPHWNAVVGGILCHNLPHLAEFWLDESTRSVPPLQAEMMWCLEHWPRETDGEWTGHRGASFKEFVARHAEALPTLTQKVIESPRTDRGRMMAAGRILADWSIVHPDLLRQDTDRDGRIYFPVAEVPHQAP